MHPPALAVELHPHSSTFWIATYYPLQTIRGSRWADVAQPLHQHLLPIAHDSVEPAQWLVAVSPDPTHSSYANHQPWSTSLAAGYAAALAVHQTQPIQKVPLLEDPKQIQPAIIMVPAGQLSEWVLDDLRDKTSPSRT